MASDFDDSEFKLGNNVQIYIDCESKTEVDELVRKPSEELAEV